MLPRFLGNCRSVASIEKSFPATKSATISSRSGRDTTRFRCELAVEERWKRESWINQIRRTVNQRGSGHSKRSQRWRAEQVIMQLLQKWVTLQRKQFDAAKKIASFLQDARRVERLQFCYKTTGQQVHSLCISFFFFDLNAFSKIIRNFYS